MGSDRDFYTAKQVEDFFLNLRQLCCDSSNFITKKIFIRTVYLPFSFSRPINSQHMQLSVF